MRRLRKRVVNYLDELLDPQTSSIQYESIQPDVLDEKFPVYTVNHHRDLYAYLVIYSSTPESNDPKIGHFSVVIDVKGETMLVNSLQQRPTGVEVQLIRMKLYDKGVMLHVDRCSGPSARVIQVIPIGKINASQAKFQNLNIQQPSDLEYWLKHRCFTQFIHHSHHSKWSALVNSQRYAKFLVEDLGLIFPYTVKLSDGEYPYPIELSISNRPR
eukprot:gene2522-2883_t